LLKGLHGCALLPTRHSLLTEEVAVVDPEHLFASVFLWGAGVAFLLVFALPLFFVPMRWARVFQWQLPEHTDLAVYLGRCLGGVALAIVVCCFRAAPDPTAHPLLFELLTLACALMTFVHIRGAIEGRQPWTETAEIALYGVMTAVALQIRWGL